MPHSEGREDSQLVLGDIDYRDMLGMVAGYTIIADSHRRIRWVNRAPIGRTPQDYIDTDLLDLAVPEQRLIVEEALERLSNGAAAVEMEIQSAATLRWHSLRLIGIVQHGVVVGTFIHALDADDAKRVQTALAIARASSCARETGDVGRFESIADALPLLIAYVDREQRYQYNNAAYEQWFDASREHIRGRTMKDVLGPTAYAQIQPYVEAALSGRPVRFESTIPYQNAGLRRMVARYVPDFTAEGELAGFYAVVEDVSAQREAEQTLRQREEQLEQLRRMEALGRLAGGIAHEFGNLLMTIITGCTAVSEAIEPGTPLATMVGQVKRAAQRGTSLTRQLLSFSRGSELSSKPIEIDALIGDLVVLLDRLLESRIELEVDLGANAWIYADPGQIQQVLMNLALNARDAMPDGGYLRVVTTLEHLTPEQATARGLQPGSHVLVTISDTGTGMDAVTRERIFDPFFTTKPPGAGTGLGLSTVYGILRKAGGHIEVDSAPGRGSVFRLYFPTCSAGQCELDPH